MKKNLATDLSAINLPHFNDKEYSLYYFYALLWFVMLSIIEAAEEYIFPPMGTPSHPSAKARYKNILENAKKPYDFKENENLYRSILPSIIDMWRNYIIEDVSLNFGLWVILQAEVEERRPKAWPVRLCKLFVHSDLRLLLPRCKFDLKILNTL